MRTEIAEYGSARPQGGSYAPFLREGRAPSETLKERGPMTCIFLSIKASNAEAIIYLLLLANISTYARCETLQIVQSASLGYHSIEPFTQLVTDADNHYKYHDS